MANADPDGYTIGVIDAPNVLTIAVERSSRYTPDDLAPVANVIYDPGAARKRASSRKPTPDRGQ